MKDSHPLFFLVYCRLRFLILGWLVRVKKILRKIGKSLRIARLIPPLALIVAVEPGSNWETTRQF